MKFDQLRWAPEKHLYSLYAQCLGTCEAKIFASQRCFCSEEKVQTVRQA